MFKFNNNHIFTGYLKQVLSSFNLPKCRIYTREQQQHHQKYLKNAAEWDAERARLSTVRKNLLEEQLYLKETLLPSMRELLKNLDPASPEDAEYIQVLQTSLAEHALELQEIPARLKAIDSRLLSLQPELNVLSTNVHSEFNIYPASMSEDLPLHLSYPTEMRYIPYIKDGKLQEYIDNKWQDCHLNLGPDHIAFHTSQNTSVGKIKNYFYGQKILNYTKTLNIQNTTYDSYTHEYLGDYLRFHRDFMNINLMPLYNCFSNRACPHLDLEFEVNKNYTARFKTDQSFETSLYKYYMVPVKFFKNYTIAIDSTIGIEVCCCIYDEYYNTDTAFSELPKLTYKCFSDLQFKAPVLYSELQNIIPQLLNQGSDLCQHEDDLKLILKIPVNNKSSIVILEGDYTTYNDLAYSKLSAGKEPGLIAAKDLTDFDKLRTPQYMSIHREHEKVGVADDPACPICNFLRKLKTEKDGATTTIKQNNRTVINYNPLQACNIIADQLITPLQLLRTNTGESYPFADRLVEYLVGNVVTAVDPIGDNITRAKTVIGYNCNSNLYDIPAEDEIWEPILQCLVYDYMNDSNKQNVHDINHDILGFIDKDVEKWYAAQPKKDATEITISNVDIYSK